MKLPQVTVRDLCWVFVVIACLCAWFRETRRVQEIARECDRIAHERNFWIQKASDVQELAVKNNCKVRYFQDGIEFRRFPLGRFALEAHGLEESSDPEIISGPEILPVVP